MSNITCHQRNPPPAKVPTMGRAGPLGDGEKSFAGNGGLTFLQNVEWGIGYAVQAGHVLEDTSNITCHQRNLPPAKVPIMGRAHTVVVNKHLSAMAG